MMDRCKVVTDTGKTCGQKAYFFCKTCSVHGEMKHCFTCVCHPQEDTVQPSMQQHFCEEHAAC